MSWRGSWLFGVILLGLAGCASTRVVPVPAAGVALDAANRSSATAADGVQLVVRPSAWRGSPVSLPSYVTPFLVRLVNGSAQPIRYEHADLLLFDEARFQYAAIPPAEVARLFQSAVSSRPVLMASAAVHAGGRPWRRPLFWDPWWDPWWGWGPYYAPPPPVDDVFLQALPVGVLHAGAQTHGFVYFPRLRREAQSLTFELHYRQGESPRVLRLPFAVERADRGASRAAS